VEQHNFNSLTSPSRRYCRTNSITCARLNPAIFAMSPEHSFGRPTLFAVALLNQPPAADA